RAQPLDNASSRQAEASCARGLDGNQIAIFGIGGSAGGNRKLLAEHFLVDRLQAAAAVGDLSEDPQHAVFGVIDDLDDAAAVTDAGLFIICLLDAKQDAVADAGGFTRMRLAQNGNADSG